MLASRCLRKLRNSWWRWRGLHWGDHPASDNVERGEQGHGAVAEVIMRHPFGIAQAHRQYRLGTLQRLDLALLVDTQDQRFVRRIEVKPNDSRAPFR
jgi:hypothetical protein